MENKIIKNTKTTATSSREISSWLDNDLESEVLSIFQPLYDHTLTKVEIEDIANTLADTAELWIKFNWRITHA